MVKREVVFPGVPEARIWQESPLARGQDRRDCGFLQGNKSSSYFERKEADEEFCLAECDEETKGK